MRRWSSWWVGGVFLAAWLWLFRGPLFTGDVCALRDAGNFYFPLFAWQCGEWADGRVPLWNPAIGLGIPALADATSSTFYPGKMIFLLPLSYSQRFNLYLAGHVLWAGATMYRVARRWSGDVTGAGLAALSYACGGAVLFQYSNVVYLVSASWLPLAIELAEQALRLRSFRRAAQFGAVLAVMTLGGDPQTAYHAGLLAAVYAGLCWWQERGLAARPAAPWWTTRPVLLAWTAVVGGVVAAVQVLPTWEWARGSERVVGARSLSGHGNPLAAAARPAWEEPLPGSHDRRIYYYSLGPWRWGELLWPNAAGRMFPQHHRWLSALPGEGRVWTPTLYLGTLPLLAAVAAARWRGATLRERWCLCLIAGGLSGSLGWFGLGWIWRELRTGLALESLPGGNLSPACGGWYWWCVQVLPGYAAFRYPAKWFVLAALGISLLSAHGWSRLVSGDLTARRRWWVVLVLHGQAFAMVMILRTPLREWLRHAPPSDLYGPLQIEGAWRDLAGGVTQALLLTLVPYLIWRWRWWFSERAGVLALSLTAFDLAAANGWLVAAVPVDHFERPLVVVNPLAAMPPRAAREADSFSSIADPEHGPVPPRWVHSSAARPMAAVWREQTSPNRVAEIVAWERQGAWHLYHLGQGFGMLDAPMTLQPAGWITRLQQMIRGATSGAATPPLVLAPHSARRAWFAAMPGANEPATSVACRVTAYEPQRVVVETGPHPEGWLVLEELADNAWIATIESLESGAVKERAGEHLAIKPSGKVEGYFRAVRLPAGEQRVEFRYEPLSFRVGSWISLIAVACGGVLLWRSTGKGHFCLPILHRGRGSSQTDRAGESA